MGVRSALAAQARPTKAKPEPRPDLLKAEFRCELCGKSLPSSYRVCPFDGTSLGPAVKTQDPLVGAVLAGAYRIVSPLSRGGMGLLYQAEHLRLPRDLVVKVIHDAYAQNDDAVARFEREARIAAQIDSPHVLKVLDVVRAPDGRPCLVSDRLLGQDLRSRLQQTPGMALREALQVGIELCQGLSAAHAHGVVHRDVKPSNVFMAEGPRGTVAKLLDFGVAKLVGAPELTRSDAVVGTPAYMAPEQARGASTVDHRADIYGVGAILYHMISGRTPYESGEPRATLFKLLSERPPSLRLVVPHLPIEVTAIVDSCLAAAPSDRPASAEVLGRRLSNALESLPDREASEARLRTGSQQSDERTLVTRAGAVARGAERRERLRRARVLVTVGSACAAGVAAMIAVAMLTGLVPRVWVWLVVFALGLGAFAHRARAQWTRRESLARLSRALFVFALVAPFAHALISLLWLTLSGNEIQHGPAAWALASGISIVTAVSSTRARSKPGAASASHDPKGSPG